MCCCCCPSLHRHQIHLISYGCVSFGLITTGLVFTVFAIFQKDSQIGKVWLAGPTTMVVGLVLCGKVIIDWGPAMLHARQGSIDSRMMDMAHPMAQMSDPTRTAQIQHYEHEPKCNGGPPLPYGTHGPPSTLMSPPPGRSGIKTYEQPSPARGARDSYREPDNPSCLIYSQYDSALNNVNGISGVIRDGNSPRYIRSSPRASSSTTMPSPSPAHSSEVCECSNYGSIRRGAPKFQGESFVLNERSYLI